MRGCGRGAYASEQLSSRSSEARPCQKLDSADTNHGNNRLYTRAGGLLCRTPAPYKHLTSSAPENAAPSKNSTPSRLPMASTVLSTATWAATEPLITAPLLYLLTRGPPHLRERILAPLNTNLLAHNGVARLAALITALKVLTSLGIVKRIDAALTQLAWNNWRFGRNGKAWKFGPGKEEVIVITGASSGFGAEMVKEFNGVARVVAIDIAPFPEELGKCECFPSALGA